MNTTIPISFLVSSLRAELSDAERYPMAERARMHLERVRKLVDELERHTEAEQEQRENG